MKNTSSSLRFAATALLVVALSGCATILSGPDKTLSINSRPEGAEVLLDGQVRGVTPMVLNFGGMNKDVRLQLRKQGYREQTVTATRELEPLAIVNCVSPICWGVDILTGAMWNFEPPEIFVSLAPEGAPAPAPTNP